jgi:phosphatidylserine/phosphatidylglycerophosphate/cardiolipin synthase-like enzyme
MHNSLLFQIYNQIIKNVSIPKKITALIFDKSNSTYHSKGLWMEKSNLSGSCWGDSVHLNSPNNHNSKIWVTYIGSSNFSHRSWYRDFELGFLIFTNSQKYGKKLINEVEHLKTYSKNISMSVYGSSDNLSMKSKKIFSSFLSRTLRSFL